MTTKQDLHRLIDALPDALLGEVERYLNGLEAERRAGPPGESEQRPASHEATGPLPTLKPGGLGLRRE